jgi:hypothetical protein
MRIWKQYCSGEKFILAGIFFCCMAALFSLISCNADNSSTARPAAKKIEDSTARNYEKAFAAVKAVEGLLQDGDLIMRSDDDIESLALQNFSNTDRTYSHSGLVFKEDGNYVVYNSMAGDENPGNALLRQPFDSFVNPLKKTGMGVFRFQLAAGEATKLHNTVKQFYADKVPFDTLFDIKNDKALYCSEMIYKALKKATGNRIALSTTMLENFTPKYFGKKFQKKYFKQFEYISLDNLYLNPFCKEITRIKY